jgi:hypothetical protein
MVGVTVRWHGQFADGTALPLMRLRYADSATT